MEKVLQPSLSRRSKKITNKKRSKPKRLIGIVLDILIIILVIITGLMITYRLTTEEAQVVGHSMDNTLANEEKVVYEKVTGMIGDYSIGDILIVKETAIKSSTSQGSDQIVKRLIAKGGDTIDFTSDGKPIVNGNQNYESYIKEQNTTKITDVAEIIRKTNRKYNTNFDENSKVIPQGYYFVMGDNRNNSSDSRIFGLYAKSDILGRVAYSHTYHHFY